MNTTNGAEGLYARIEALERTVKELELRLHILEDESGHDYSSSPVNWNDAKDGSRLATPSGIAEQVEAKVDNFWKKYKLTPATWDSISDIPKELPQDPAFEPGESAVPALVSFTEGEK